MLKLYHFLSLIALYSLFQICISQPYFNPYNGHEYQLISQSTENVLATFALSDCASRTSTYGRGQGYLATFTNKLEWNWANSTVFPNYEIWLGGYNNDQDYKTWYYSAGPEKNQLFYTTAGVCLGYCPWSPLEPSRGDSEYYLATWVNDRATANSYLLNNLAGTKKLKGYVCEFGGMGQPIAQGSVSTNGGLVSFGGFNGVVTSSNVVFTQIGPNVENPTVLNCPVQQNTTSSFTCLLPGGSGIYNATVEIDGVSSNSTFQFLPPSISYIYPNFEMNQLLTIVGNNFGNDGSKISISFGYSKSNHCVNSTVTTIKKNQVIICTLESNITTSSIMTPIFVDINGVETISNTPSIFDGATNSFYTISKICAGDFTSATSVANSYSLEGYQGYLGVVQSIDLFNAITKTFGRSSGSNPITLWEGLAYSNSNYNYYSGHPNASKIASPYYVNPPSATPSGSSRFTLNLQNGKLDTSTSSCSFLIQNGGLLPILDQFSPSTIPTSGIQLNVNVRNPGYLLSNIVFKANVFGVIQTLESVATDIDNPSKYKVTIPSGIGGPFIIWVEVDNIKSNQMTYSYEQPILTSISPAPRTNGGEAIVVGQNLFNQVDLLKLVVNGKPIPMSDLIGGTQAKVQIPPGTGVFTALITLNGTASAPQSFSYVAPHIDEIESSASNLESGYVTIKGYSFGNDSSLISVQGITPLDQPAIVTPHTEISFKVPPIKDQTTITIKVDNQLSNEIDIPIHTINTTLSSVSSIMFNQTGNVTITGSGFFEYETNVTIGGKPCDKLFFINSTMMICYFTGDVLSNGTALPVAIYSGPKLITWDYLYFYQNNITCVGGCSDNGVCNTDFGECKCDPGFGGSKCEFKQTKPSNAPSVNGDGSSTLTSEKMIFNIGIKYIREVTPTSIVRTLNMSSIIWEKSSDGSGANYTKQGDYIYLFNGTFPNDECSVRVNITIYLESKDINFAGEVISMMNNSVKFQVDILNWKFASSLNALQLIYDSTGDRQNVEEGCPLKVPIPTGNVTLFDVPVLSQGVVLQGKYSQRMITDQRPSLVRTVVLVDTEEEPLFQPPVGHYQKQHDVQIMTAMIVPYFETKTTLDPNFGLLLTDDQGTVPPCSNGKQQEKSKKNKWKVPVITVLVVVGAIAIITGATLYVKKRLMGRRFKDVAMTKLSQLSKK